MPTPRFTVTYADGKAEEIRMRPRAQIAYEADTGEPLFKESDQVHMTMIYKMAWYGAGQPETLEDWLENIDDVEMLPMREGEGVPTSDGSNPPTAEDLPD